MRCASRKDLNEIRKQYVAYSAPFPADDASEDITGENKASDTVHPIAMKSTITGEHKPMLWRTSNHRRRMP